MPARRPGRPGSLYLAGTLSKSGERDARRGSEARLRFIDRDGTRARLEGASHREIADGSLDGHRPRLKRKQLDDPADQHNDEWSR